MRYKLRSLLYLPVKMVERWIKKLKDEGKIEF